MLDETGAMLDESCDDNWSPESEPPRFGAVMRSFATGWPSSSGITESQTASRPEKGFLAA
jgi:hypothetical protein